MRRIGNLFEPDEVVGILPFGREPFGGSSPMSGALSGGFGSPSVAQGGSGFGLGATGQAGSSFGLDTDPFAKLRGFGASAQSGSPFDKLTGGFFDQGTKSPFDLLKGGIFDPATFGQNAPSGMGQQGTMGAGAGAAGLSVVGGEWSKLDAHNGEIASASSRLGVPANLLKSMINRESSGNWGPGYDQSYGGFRNDDILPFVGIFRQTADAWGLDYDAMIGNKQAQIDGMATIMKGLAEQHGGFENAVKVYFGGPQALTGTFVDELGMDSNTYGQKAIDDWKSLDARGGGGGSYQIGTTTGTSVGGHSIDSMLGAGWGVSQEFGAEGGPALYGYGTAYGLNGTQHTGLDVATPRGTAMRAPMSGVVTCGGTGNGSGGEGNGCSAFGDADGGGAGRVELLLDDGTVLIYGHAATSAFQPGQRVNAGDVIGTSGGMFGAHTHLEARRKDANGNWKIIDPRMVGGSGGTTGQATSNAGGYADRLRAALFG